MAALTIPGDAVGEVYANLRISDDFVVADTERGLREAGQASEGKRAASDIGEEWGRVSSESFGRRVGREGPAIAREVEQGLRRQRIRLPDIDGKETGRRWARSAETGLLGAIVGSSALNKVGSTISDAIGAGFNVSGRSPLITLILPIIGAIVALILAAVHGLHALIALLYSVPNILFAIGLQAGILLLIFHNVGTAIAAAFQAKNATELKEALKGLNPELAKFIKTLLPLKKVFEILANIAQTKFFSAFDLGGKNPFIDILEGLDSLPKVVKQVSSALGTAFRNILEFFATPKFDEFFSKMGDSVTRFLSGFDDGITNLLLGLTNFGIALIPFADKVGAGFNNMLSKIGGWLTKLSNDEDFLDWLDRAFGIIDELVDLGYAFIQFFMTLAQVLDETGAGDALLVQLKEFVQILSFLMQTEGGRKAIEGLVHAALLLTAGFVGLVIVIGFVLASLESFFEFLRYQVWPWLEENVPKIGDAIAGFFTDFFPKIAMWLLDLFNLIVNGFWNFLEFLGTKIAEGLQWGLEKLREFTNETIPNKLIEWTHDFINWLFEPGQNLIKGLIRGMLSMIPGVEFATKAVAGKVKDGIPSSPAKYGPLSGSGDPYLSGQEIVNRISNGMLSVAPKLTNTTNNVAGEVANSITMMSPTGTVAPTSAGTATTSQNPQTINVKVQIGDQELRNMVGVEINKVMRTFGRQLALGTRVA